MLDPLKKSCGNQQGASMLLKETKTPLQKRGRALKERWRVLKKGYLDCRRTRGGSRLKKGGLVVWKMEPLIFLTFFRSFTGFWSNLRPISVKRPNLVLSRSPLFHRQLAASGPWTPSSHDSSFSTRKMACSALTKHDVWREKCYKTVLPYWTRRVRSEVKGSN